MKNDNKHSYFISKVDSKPHVRSTKPLEVEDRTELLHNLLSEFEQSTSSQKETYHRLLKDWLDRLDESSINNEDEHKVRDFIYEMF